LINRFIRLHFVPLRMTMKRYYYIYQIPGRSQEWHWVIYIFLKVLCQKNRLKGIFRLRSIWQWVEFLPWQEEVRWGFDSKKLSRNSGEFLCKLGNYVLIFSTLILLCSWSSSCRVSRCICWFFSHLTSPISTSFIHLISLACEVIN